MWFKNLVQFWTNWKDRNEAKRRKKNSKPDGRWARALLNCETLEDRAVPATFTVNTLVDELVPADGFTSLREAIIASNATPGTTDTINFSVSGTIFMTDAYGEMLITDDVIIDGPGIGGTGAGGIVVDGLDDSRIFEINDGSALTSIDVHISGLTLTNGNGQTYYNGLYFDGGTVLVANENLFLYNVDITSSHSVDDGGAIAQFGGNLYIRHVGILDNVAEHEGGGIFFSTGGDFYTDITIIDAEFEDNVAGGAFNTGDYGSGGAIYLYVGADWDYSGDLRISDTDFFYNHADGVGGAIGIHVYGDMGGQFYISDSSLYNNYSFFSGGAVDLSVGGNFYGIIDVDPTIFYLNQSNAGDGGAVNLVFGGDVSGQISFDNTYFDNNTAIGGDGGGLAIFIGGDLTSTGSISVYGGDYYTGGGFFANHSTYDGGGANIDIVGDLHGSIDFSSTYFNFNNSDAYGGGYTGQDGGGLAIKVGNDIGDYGSITIDHTLFFGNYARYDGGGAFIQVDGYLYGDITVNHSYFNNNFANGTSASDGGGIYIEVLEDIGGSVTIRDTTFYDNYANDDGGAVYLYAGGDVFGSISIEGSTFGYYTFLDGDHGNAAGDDGGAVSINIHYDLFGSITVSGSYFVENDAGDDGGGLDVDVGDVYGTITLSGDQFYRNYSGTNGAGASLSIEGYLDGAVTVEDTTFDENFAINNGGGLYAYVEFDINGSFTLDTITSHENTAHFFDGGGVDLRVLGDLDGSVNIYYFTSNEDEATYGDGGGINLYIGDDLTVPDGIAIANSSFTHDHADDYGGGVNIDIFGRQFGPIDVTNTDFFYNTAQYGAGGGLNIYVAGDIYGDITIDPSYFYGNTAATTGGGLSIFTASDLYGGTITIDSSYFYNNTAGTDGGGAYIGVADDVYAGAAISVTGGSFNYNHATGDGGGLRVTADQFGFFGSGASFDITGTNFRYNEAGGDGAGVSFAVATLYGDVTVSTSNFFYNDAGGEGGGMAVTVGGDIYYAGSVNVLGTYFYGNSANDGGGLDIDADGLSGYITIGNSHFFNNYSYTDGGAVDIELNSIDVFGVIDIYGSSFDNNVAHNDDGGGVNIAVTGDIYGDINVTDSTFTRNYTYTDGGGMSLYVGGDFYGNFNVNTTTFYDNTSLNFGGGLAFNVYGNMVGDASITNSNFNNNYAFQGGGGVDLYFQADFRGNVTIDQSTFYSNDTAGDGGGLNVYIYGPNAGASGTVAITYSTFDRNTADAEGGGIRFFDNSSSSTLFIGYSAITRNESDYDGGGLWLYSDRGYVTIVNSTIAYNQAFDDGAGIYVEFLNNQSLAIYNSTIAENTAVGDGGGINSFNDVLLVSTILANNHSTLGVGNDIAGGGTFYAYYSLIGDTADTGGSTITGANNIYDVNPDLGPLQNNGGLTETMALLSGSPAIDSGFNPVPLNLAYDQRGAFYAREVGTQTDIGAYELQGPVGPTTVDLQVNKTVSDSTPNVGQNITFTITVKNAANSLTATGVELTDLLPTGLDFVSSTESQGSFVSGTGVWTVGSLDSGDTATLTITAKVTSAALPDVLNEADITAVVQTDRDTSNDQDSITVTPNSVAPLPEFIVVGAGFAQAGIVQDGIIKVFDEQGNFQFQINAFPGFTGGVSVAFGDVNNDGVFDIICGTATGGDEVRVFDGVTHTVILDLHAFSTGSFVWAGGVNVASGDITDDGFDDIIVGGPGGGPAIWTFNGKTGAVIDGFFAFTATNFSGGVSVAAGDVDGNGIADVIAGAGPGGGPAVAVLDAFGNFFDQFFAFDPSFTGGVNVAAGDVNDDGTIDIITATATLDGTFRVWSGFGDSILFTQSPFDNQFGPWIGGLRIGAADFDQDGKADFAIGAGPGGGPAVYTYEVVGNSLVAIDGFFAFDSTYHGGIFVG